MSEDEELANMLAMATHATSDVELMAELMLRDFRDFIPLAFPHALPGQTYKHNWHIDVIADHLQAVTDGEIDRLLINVPPGTMKSVLVSVMWPCWMWAKDPTRKFLFVTYGEKFTKRDARVSRNLINSQWFRQHFPGTRTARAKNDDGSLAPDSILEYGTTKGGLRTGGAVNSGVTGKHVNGICEDDLMKAQDAHSKAARESAWDFHSGTLPSRLLPDGHSWRVHVAQRLHTDDPSGRILKEGGWEHLKLPMHYNPKRVVLTSLGKPDPREDEGELLWPDRMSEKYVQGRAKGMGPHNVAAQEEQDPTALEGGIIKRAWMQKRWTRNMLPDHFDIEWISADLAITDTSDPIAVQRWGFHRGDFYLLQRMTDLVALVNSYQVVLGMASKSHNREAMSMAKVIENKANGHAMIDLNKSFAKNIPGFVPWNPGNRDKVVRLNAVSPIYASGNVWLPDITEDPTIEDYVEQVCGFPSSLHDDEVDASSQAILWFQENHESMFEIGFSDIGMGAPTLYDPSMRP